MKKVSGLSPYQAYLYEDFRERVLAGTGSHIAIAAFLMSLIYLELWSFGNSVYLGGLAVIINATIRRLIFGGFVIKTHAKMRLFSFFSIFQGVLWGAWISQVKLHFGTYSQMGVTFLIVLSGLIAAAIYSMGKMRIVFSLFVFAALSTSSFGFFASEQWVPGDFKLPIIFVIFYLFLLRTQGMIAKQFKDLYYQQGQTRDLLDQLPAAISVIENDTFIHANKALLELVGLSQEQLIHHKVNLHNSNSELIKNAITVMNSNLDSLTFESDLFSKAESKSVPHIVTIKKSPMNPKTIVITSVDIRKIKEKDGELSQQKILLQQASKMASLGEMASGLAHEINNPLSIIMVRAGIIHKEASKESPDLVKVKADANKINTTVVRISKIINALRTFARDATSEPMSETTFKAIIDDTLSFCEEKFKLNNVIIELIDDDQSIARCRPIQVSQAILNALNNSFDAIKGRDDADRWIRIETSRTDGFAQCRITDSGTEMTAEIAEKVFQPFFTTKEVGQGTGLGMSISKGLIESQQGELFFDLSSKNTCLVLRLPLAEVAEQAA